MQSFPSTSFTSQRWYMNEFTYVWPICLCIYTCICIIQHGIGQCLLWWQRNPCRYRALSLQPQSAHVLFTHVFFSSISANLLPPHCPSFSLGIWKHHVWFLLFPLAFNPKCSIASAVLNNLEIQRMKLKKNASGDKNMLPFSRDHLYFCCDPTALTSLEETKEGEVSVFPDSKIHSHLWSKTSHPK